MIQLNSLQLPRQGGEYYTLAFQRLRFALLDAHNLDYLSAFSRENQASLGRTEVRVQMGWLQAYLSFFRTINYVLLTQYQEILLLPFLLRKCPQIKVVATSLMYELARIYLLTFQQKVKDYDATSPVLTFDEERDIRELYEQKYELDLTNSPTIFSKKEAEEALKCVIKVNYFQVYDTERGVLLIAHPSGRNNGACVWEMQGQTTKEKILLVNDISQHRWRTCQPYNLPRLKLSDEQRPFDYVIFTKRALANLNNQGEEQRAAQTVVKITSNMNNSISTVIILSDQTTAVDLIPRIAFQPQGRCQAAFFSHPSFHDLNNFCNSYVDYLSDSFRNIIFSESPDYPLVHYSRLSGKGLINTSGLEDTAIKNRIPVREVVLQNAPLVLFIKNYEHLLQMEDLSAIYQHTKYEEIQFSVKNNFTKTHLDKFISNFTKAKIYCFGIDPIIPNVNVLPLNMRHSNGQGSRPCYIRTANLTSSKIQQYKLINNQLLLHPVNKEVLLLPKGFMDQIFNQFVKRGIPILHKDKTTIKTQKTTLTLSEQYTLKVSSTHIEEVLILERILTPIIERFSFK